MRKFLFSVLLATTAATPALAQPRLSLDRDSVREQRSESREERREERREESPPPRVERVEPRVQERPVERAGSGEAAPERPVVRRVREATGGAPAEPPRLDRGNVNERGRPTLPTREAVAEGVAQWRERDRGAPELRGQAGGDTPWRERATGNPREAVIDRWVGREDRRVRPPEGARPDRPAPAREVDRAHRGHTQWRTDWRRDHRYDWRRWRDRDRSRFRLGFYFDPFGWNYHRFGIGWRMWPSYYSNRYWLHDPWSYRLPQAPWPYRWVRYYDDAVLVNTMTGRVADVIHNFFW